MSARFLIEGGKPLVGLIHVRGSKNAALPILAATLLTNEHCRIKNLPLVNDVHAMLKILHDMGSKIAWIDKHSIEIENQDIDPRKLSRDIVKKMRASILLLGPLLARFGRVEKMRYPGGCSIGARPIDVHLDAFVDLGARVLRDKHFFSVFLEDCPSVSRTFVLSEFSVTATENLMIFLSALPFQNEIRIAASEPHVADLAKFLKKLGAIIEGAGTSTVQVKGCSKLKGATHIVAPDYIEAGTFLLMSLAVGGDMEIKNAPVSHLDLVIKKLVSSGAEVFADEKKQVLRVKSGGRIRLERIQTMPYPGMPTDLQSAFAVLASQTFGKTLIHEPMYERRLEFLKELARLGARVEILDPHRAYIYGPARLYGAEVSSLDLRSASALVVAGLAAKGATIIHGAEHAQRGYEDFDGRLRKLGANIKKIS